MNREALKQLRAQNGWTQEELARRVGCHRRRVQELENGEKGGSAKLETIRDFAEALGVTAKDIIYRDAPAEILNQARDMGIDLMLKVPVSQNDPGGELASFASFMAEAMEEYAKYIEDRKRESGLAGFAEFMRDKRRQDRKAEAYNQIAPEELESFKNLRMYVLNSFDRVANEPVYFYVLAHNSLHDKLMESLKDGNLPDFAVIVARGYGKPSDDVKAMIKAYYGFDHDKHATG